MLSFEGTYVPYFEGTYVPSFESTHVPSFEGTYVPYFEGTYVPYFEGTYVEKWGAGVETQKNVRGEVGGWGRVPFNEPYAPLLSTIYDGA